MVAAFREPPRSRWSIAFGAALALHAACAFVGYRVARDAALADVDATPRGETEIELLDAPVEMQGTPSDPNDERGDPVVSSAVALSSSERSRDHRGDTVAPGSVQGPSSEPSAVAGNAEGSYALDPTPGAAPGTAATGKPIELGIGSGDWSRWVDPTAAPSREGTAARDVPAPVSSTGGLAEALEARDQALGLGPAGAVLTAVHEAGYSEIAPALGTAVFSITVLRTGAIDVQVTGASSQPEAWAKVGERIAAAIRKKPPHIAPTRIGVRLGIEVVAEERWPNGQPTRSVYGPKIAAAPPKFQMTETAKEALLERNPAAVPEPDAPAGKPPLQANYDAPGVFVEGKGKVCSYRIGLSPIPISGACDPTNIGQPARRVVSTRVVSQTML